MDLRFGGDTFRRALGPLLGIAALLAPAGARAQDVSDADTLPAHVGGVILKPGLLLGGGGSRFGPGWRFDRQSFLADFDRLNLADVLAGNGATSLKTIFGDFGTTRFEAQQLGIGLNIAAAYGITDRLTIAAFLPWQYSKYEFEAWLEPSFKEGIGSRSGTVVTNQTIYPSSHYAVKDPQAITCPGGQFRIDRPEDLDKIVVDRGMGYRFNIDDVRKAFISDCLNYTDILDSTYMGSDGNIHGVSNRTYSGFRDLIIGAKYQFFHGRKLQLAAIAYVIAPTGAVEDPRDLFQVKFGDGTWNAALLAGITVPVGKLHFFGSAGYEYVFSDTHERRLRTVNFSDDLERKLARREISEQQLYDEHLDEGSIIPISTKYDQAMVRRKLGDNIYIYSGASYDITEWLNFGVRVDFWHHFRDEITSIGARFENTEPYQTEAQIRAAVDQLVANGTVPEDSDMCFQEEARNCRTKELIGRLRDSDGRRRAAYAWHTVRGQIIGGVGLTVNTLGPFVRGEFPLPIIAGVQASAFLAGQNIDITDQIGLSLVIPIPIGDVKDPAEYGYDDEPEGGLPWP